MKITNNAGGPRGVNLTNGGTVYIEAGASQSFKDEDVSDAHDDLTLSNDGEDETDGPVSLSGKNKAELTAIAAEEGVDLPDGATNAQIIEAITAKRDAASE